MRSNMTAYAKRQHSRKHPSSVLPSSLKLISSVALIAISTTVYMLIVCGKDWLSVTELIAPIISNQAFTPLHLFFLLNLLIVSIILMTRFHRETAPPTRQARADSSPQEVCDVPPYLGTPPPSYQQENYKSTDYARPQTQSDYNEQDKRKQNQYTIDAQRQNSREFTVDLFPGESAANSCEDYADINLPVKGDRGYATNNGREIDQNAADQSVDTADAGYSYGERHETSTKEVTGLQVKTNTAKVDAKTEIGSTAASGEGLINRPKNSGANSPSSHVERPLASTHFSHKRLISKAHASKSPLKLARPSARKGDTLEATWKAICDAKSKHSSHCKSTRARKGSDGPTTTVDNFGGKDQDVSLSSPTTKQRRRHTPTSSSTNGFIRRRELSMPRDELNARVESFISKFNQQIRIQREQSLLGYKSSVNRGAR